MKQTAGIKIFSNLGVRLQASGS